MLEIIQTLDERCLHWIADNLRGTLDGLMVFYTRLGNGGALFIALAVVLLFFRKTRKAGACAGVGMLLGALTTNLILKPLVSRGRPWVTIEGFEVLTFSNDPNSFPSGHSCAAFACSVALALVLPQKWARAAALAAAALMAFSRLYVGVHYPSDVLAGVLIGTVCGLLGVWIVNKITARRAA